MNRRERPYKSVQTWNEDGGHHGPCPYIIRADTDDDGMCPQIRTRARSAVDLPVIEGEFHEL